MRGPMRLLQSIATVLLAASFAVSFAQQEDPPAPPQTEPAPPPAPPPAEPEQDEADTPPAPGEDVDDVFIPTEELQPDAAVTFPVDI